MQAGTKPQALRNNDEDEEQIHQAPIRNKDIFVEEQMSSRHNVDSFQIEKSIEQQNHYEQQQYNLQTLPKKVILLTLGLTLFGIFFTLLGVFDLLIDNDTDFQRGVAFLVLGIIMLIPGSYYSVHLYYYYKATSVEEQQQILNEFPID